MFEGDATVAVDRLKREHDKTLVIFGSGVLLRSLMRRELVDTFLLMVHPLVLGKGHRLFNDAPLTHFTLTDQTATTTGVIVATYQRTFPS